MVRTIVWVVHGKPLSNDCLGDEMGVRLKTVERKLLKTPSLSGAPGPFT